VAAAHLQALPVELEVDVDEGERAEQHEQAGGDASHDGHRQRGDAGVPRRVHGQLDTERHAGGADQRKQPLDPVGGAAGPDVRMRGGVGLAGLPHVYEVTQVQPGG
jgi:hypothetical protein